MWFSVLFLLHFFTFLGPAVVPPTRVSEKVIFLGNWQLQKKKNIFFDEFVRKCDWGQILAFSGRSQKGRRASLRMKAKESRA